MISEKVRAKERELLLVAQKETPQLFTRQPFIDDEDVLKLIGIENVFKSARPIGYIRLYPSDFIVEEIAENGKVHTVDPPRETTIIGSGPTHYADLVKIGLSTLDAKKEIAEHLGIDTKYISSAGLKDESAITSQCIGIRHLSDGALLTKTFSERFFLKNISRGKGYIGIGRLRGNRFTIVIRLCETPSRQAVIELQNNLKYISEEGFWNFFYTQRFGIPRLITHLEGLLLLDGQYEEAIKTCFTYLSLYEIPYFHEIRKKIAASWKDWEAIEYLIEPFPLHFISELALVAYLKKNPDDFVGALTATRDETRIWAYSYASYLFNRKLSALIQSGAVPEKFPLITSFQKEDWNYYKEFTDADSVYLKQRVVEDLPFLRATKSTWPAVQRTDIHAFELEGDIATISFSLPKGSYATSFLSNFFTLASDLPILPGISTLPVDAKKILKIGSLVDILEYFKNVLDRRKEEIKKGFS
jgi:TruD family tRNA pseudouridine synthase